MRLFKSLFGQVVLALLIGVIVGLAWPGQAVSLKPLGDGFIRLVKMLIPLIIFCVVVHGMAGTGDLRRVGRVGVKSLIYFEVVTTIALALGLVLALVFQPGVGMNVDPQGLDASALSAYATNAERLSGGGISDFLLKLIPTTAISAFANGDVLQVLLFSILFGAALALLGQRGARVVGLIEDVSLVLFKIMGIIIRLAPLGVLGAIAFTVGQYGIGSLRQLGMLVILFYVSVILFVAVVLAATLQAVPAIPAIGLVLVLSVDWFMGIARALGNLVGNCVATVAIAAWEGDIDRERAHAVLDGTLPLQEALPVPAESTS